jgi:rRNA maturation RNase YbeY
MPVLVSTRGGRSPTLLARVRRSGPRLLAALRMPQAELSVVLVDDRHIRRLNREYRGRDRPTDVLSFAQQEGPAGAPAGLLGDVVISVPATRRQARERGVRLAAEGDRLLVHGVLHLLGYDHEGSAAEARRMRRRERALARVLDA